MMGIVNVTPDSFSDGGAYDGFEAALAHALRLIDEGADVLDIGGESTRPGATAVGEGEELARTIPLILAIREKSAVTISIDTMKPAVARAAMSAGATMWNDVSALSFASDSLATAAELGCDLVLMHMQGDPVTMQQAPSYQDVVAEVCNFLLARAEAAMAAGIGRTSIWLDPGIGFGKTAQHNLDLIAGLDRLVAVGFPVLFGASRKGFIRAVDPSAKDPSDRLGGSLAAVLAAARSGVAMVRVHDVAATVQALDMASALDCAKRGLSNALA